MTSIPKAIKLVGTSAHAAKLRPMREHFARTEMQFLSRIITLNTKTLWTKYSSLDFKYPGVDLGLASVEVYSILQISRTLT